MKKVALAAVAATALLALKVSADDTRIPAGVFTNAQTADQYLANDSLIGAKVHNQDGAIIGDIEDLIINDSNQVVGVIMGTGGFAGYGEKKIGVNLSALKFNDENGVTTVSLPEATPEVLSATEPFKRTQPGKSLLQRAQEKAKELTEKSTTTSKEALEKAKPAFEETKQKAQEALEKAKETAAPALDAAKAAAKEGLDVAKDALEKAGEAAKEAIDKAKDAAAPAPAEGEAMAPAEPTPSDTPPEAMAPGEPPADATPEAMTPEETPPAEGEGSPAP